MTNVARLAAVMLPLLLMANPAAAHVAAGMVGGFQSGFIHPVLGPDHLVAMVAVGLWGAILGPPLLWVLPITFPLLMAVGGVLGINGVPLPAVELMVALSAVVLGICVATAFRPPVWLGMLIVAVFAICHGHAHGGELPEAADPLSYGMGFVLATGLLHLLGITIGFAIKRFPAFGLSTVRACGVFVALAGLYFAYGVVGGA